MNKLKYIFQSSLILVFLSVLVQNNVAAEPTINIEQLFGFYANIVEKAQSGNPDLAISILSNIIKMDPKALKEQGVPTECRGKQIHSIILQGVSSLIRTRILQ